MAALIGVMAMPSAAWANCTGTFTFTHNGSGGSSYSLNSGQSLRIQSGTYTGNIDNLASSASICVDSGATFNPGNLNNVSGQLVNYGTVNFPNVNFSAGFTLDNFYKVTFTSNANFNGAVTFRNRANADLIFRQTVQFGNGSSFVNDGRVIADGNFNLQSGTTFTNSFEILVRDTFNPDGIVDNYGRIHAERFININSSSTATNYCSWIADEGFNNNSPRTTTYGLIFINWQGSGSGNLFQNNQAFKVGPDSITYGWRFMNNSTVTNATGAGGGKFVFKDPGGIPASEHTKNQGPFSGVSSTNPIIFYDDTRSTSAVFDTGQTPSNTIRQVLPAPPIDHASPTCSPAIRQIMTDPNPPAETYDYSDAPASYGAPVHQIVAGYKLGTAAPDWDGGPFATPNADGDDLSGSDDEDGITLPTFQKGVQTTLDVRVSGANGRLQAWIDYDGNGVFDSGEKIANNAQDNGSGTDPVAEDGLIRIIFTPPASATSNQTFLRLRWSTQTDLNATAAAPDGEVEDYAFTFGVAPPPTTPPGGGSVPSSCPADRQLLAQPGNGLSQTSTNVTSPGQALGALSPNGSYASSSNAASLGANAVLTVDLTGAANKLVAAGGDIILSLARHDSGSRLQVQSSADGTNWTTIGTYGSGGTLGNDFNDGVLLHVMFEAPAAGVRYVRFTREAGTFWVDGLSFADLCGPIATPAKLTIVKTSAVFAPGTFMVPGNDVAYAITVTNTGESVVDSDALLLVDTLPGGLSFYNGDYGAAGSGAVIFSQNGAGLTFSQAANLRFSNAGTVPTSFAQCTYTPAAGYDPAIRYICVRPSGAMAGGNPSPTFTIQYRARIN